MGGGAGANVSKEAAEKRKVKKGGTRMEPAHRIARRRSGKLRGRMATLGASGELWQQLPSTEKLSFIVVELFASQFQDLQKF